MKSLILICHLLVLYGMAVGVIKDYVYVSDQLSWWSADYNCWYNHRGFARITSEKENQRALDVSGQKSSPVWIGLSRTSLLENTWQWSGGGQPGFTKWANGEPNDKDKGDNCVGIDPYGWIGSDCGKNYPFICYGYYFTLVKENKTWEEALKHCRQHYADLAFVDSETLLVLLETETEQTQTASVWTGLHFLDGKWFWVNGMPVGSLISLSLPSCPVQPYLCGVYDFSTNIWENRDCNEELHFFCYY